VNNQSALDAFRLFPPEASTAASRVDALFLFELGVATAMSLLILTLIVYAAVRYRRTSADQVPPATRSHTWMEIAWSILPLMVMAVMFFWGARLFAWAKRPPVNAMEIHILGKQWMWKIEHPEGIREIDALHVPANVPVRLVMTSQDVIHDFSIPAFRIKQDVLPGSYSSEWFVATVPGEYHLFCSQYCGTFHSRMIGKVVVMSAADYQQWLEGHAVEESPAASGSKLFTAYGCAVCHGQRAPTMANLYMRQVRLDDGRTVVADEDYLRESILFPAAKIVAGYQSIMPSYRGQLTEDQIFDLITYIKSQGSPQLFESIPNQPPVHEDIRR
jgi:cytochrome c oxidase subunit 2